MASGKVQGTAGVLSTAWSLSVPSVCQIEYSMVTQTSSSVELRCSATQNTWLNQRRKRRLLLQLEKLHQANAGLCTYMCVLREGVRTQ